MTSVHHPKLLNKLNDRLSSTGSLQLELKEHVGLIPQADHHLPKGGNVRQPKLLLGDYPLGTAPELIVQVVECQEFSRLCRRVVQNRFPWPVAVLFQATGILICSSSMENDEGVAFQEEDVHLNPVTAMVVAGDEGLDGVL